MGGATSKEPPMSGGMGSSGTSSMQILHHRVPLGTGWDLQRVVDLEGGMQLIYEGEGALSKGAYGVIFPCKLKLGEDQGHRVIDAVVKCENRECNDKDGYEIHKVREIPHHGNIVKFYDGKVLGPDESKKFGALMVFERMDCNLKQLVFKDKAFAEVGTYKDLVNMLQQIVQGLQHLQKNKYIHLDLKPQNVLVARNPGGRFTIKMGDFGESKAVNGEGHSVTATNRGTERYMAPEVKYAPPFSNRSRRITALADVFSLGMLMCALFNRQDPPFTTQAWGSHGREIWVGDGKAYKVFCGAPLELCNLIEKCLRFKYSNIDDSRKHGRPSLRNILEALRNMKECKWVTQTLQTKVCLLHPGLQRGFHEVQYATHYVN